MEIFYYCCLNPTWPNLQFNRGNFLQAGEKAEDFDIAQMVHKYNFGALIFSCKLLFLVLPVFGI